MRKLAKKIGSLLVLLLCFHASHSQTTKLYGASTNLGGSVYSLNTDGTNLTTHKIFSPNGSKPLAKLTVGSDGKLYGMTSEGGQHVLGVIFKVNTDGTGFTKIHEFNGDDGAQPQGALVEGSDGYFYGMTPYGGANNGGVLFKINSDGSDFIQLLNFATASGTAPHGSLILASDGALYGMTSSGGANGYGTVFSMLENGAFTLFFNFSLIIGTSPKGDLLEAADGYLYGMTGSGGTSGDGAIFKMQKDGGGFAKLHDFDNTNGANPIGGLIQDSGGTLYGTTSRGGASDEGVIFKIETNGSGFSDFHNFGNSDGRHPQSTLVMDGNVLYGATPSWSGTNGILFKIQADGSSFTTLHEFDDDIGDGYPYGGLILSGGELVGTTSNSGYPDVGRIFKFDITTSVFTDIYSFVTPDGLDLEAELIQATNGRLFGTTTKGGTNSTGVIFSMNHIGANYQVVHQFSVSDIPGGVSPAGGLVQNDNQDLLGMTTFGGTTPLGGVIFKIKPDGTDYTVLHNFDYTNGGIPYGGLTKGPENWFYGVTKLGGANDKGIVFKIQGDGTGYANLHDFGGTSGEYPYGTMAIDGDGYLYGMTNSGGTNDKGIIFKIHTNGTGFQVILTFDGTNGIYPYGNLVLAANGDLYGEVPKQSSESLVFRINTDGTGFTSFSLPGDNNYHSGSIIQAPSGEFYGTTYGDPGIFGGDPGFVFKFNEDFGGYEELRDLSLTNGFTKSKLLLADIAKQNQTITFNPVNAAYYGDPPFNLGATASSGLSVTYASSNTDVATISGNSVTIVGGGSTIITAMQDGNDTYFAANNHDREFIVYKINQTITFDPLPDESTGNPPFALDAYSSSGLTISYSSSNHSVATVSGNMVTMVGTGTTTITASQPGNSAYNPAPDVEQILTVKLPQTITFNPLETKYPDDPPFTLSATSTSGLTVSYQSSDTNVATISGNTVTIVGLGSATITASQPGDAAYSPAADVDQVLLVEMRSQTITFSPLVPIEFGAVTSFELTATATSGLPVTYSSSDEDVATVFGTTLTITGIGSTIITASQAGNTAYQPAPDVTQTLVVSMGNQTIYFDLLPTKTILDAPFDLTAVASSGLTVSYSSSDEGVATISGNTVTIVGLGATDITATQPGDNNYNSAPDVIQSLTVSKADQSITFNTVPPKTLGGPPFDLTATSSSGLSVTYSSSNPSVATISGNTVTLVAIGSSIITASQAGDDNYNAAPDVTRTLNVNLAKSDQTITFNTLPLKTYTNTPFTLSASSSSGLTVSYSSSQTSVATVSGSTVTITGIGSTSITASQPGDNDFNPAVDVAQTLTVSKGNQTITFGVLPTKAFGDVPFALSAAASSGLTVSYSTSNGAVASIIGSAVTINGVGTATITASQAGDANFEAAASVQQDLIVSKSAQTITFSAIPDKVLGSAPFTLGPTSSSGMAVSLTTLSDKITIAGAQVTLVKAGRATINADHPGNQNYQAAATVSQAFCVNPAKPVVTIIAQSSGITTMASSNTVGNQWYFNDNAIAGATAATLTVTENGSYTVRTIVDNCSSELSNPLVGVITGDIYTPAFELLIYPNPARDELWISLDGQVLDRTAEIQVIDQLGRKLEVRKEWINNRVKLDISRYGKGLHLLMIQGRDLKAQKSFVKE